MSADNGIFIFQHCGKFYVTENTLSAMPYAIPQMLRDGISHYGEPYYEFTDINRADAKARAMAQEFYKNQRILEYGVVDWSKVEASAMLLEHGCSWDELLERSPKVKVYKDKVKMTSKDKRKKNKKNKCDKKTPW